MISNLFKYFVYIISLAKLAHGACSRSLDLTPVPGTNCFKFYRCDGTTLRTFNCAPATRFNPVKKVCDWPNSVTCIDTYSETSTISPIQTSTMETTSIQPDTNIITNFDCSSGLDLTLVPGDDCSRYYICDTTTNKLFVNTCPSTTLFDVNVKNCVPETVYTCPVTKTTAKPVTTTPASSTNQCPSIDYTPVPGSNCSKYYQCIGNTPIQVACPAGEKFDSSFSSCTSLTNSCIESVPTPTTCSDLELTAVPTDCSQFYRCNGNELTTLSCPPGHHWDSTKKACDFPYNIQGYCGTNAYGVDNCPSLNSYDELKFICSLGLFKLDYPNCCV